MKKIQVITARTSAENYNELLEISREKERSISWLINKSIELYIKDYKEKVARDPVGVHTSSP